MYRNYADQRFTEPKIEGQNGRWLTVANLVSARWPARLWGVLPLTESRNMRDNFVCRHGDDNKNWEK